MYLEFPKYQSFNYDLHMRFAVNRLPRIEGGRIGKPD